MATPSDHNVSDTKPAATAGASTFSPPPSHDALVAQGGAIQRAAPSQIGTASGPARPAILNAAPKPLDLLQALQRRWWLALILAVCFTVPAACIAWFSTPVSYSAQSWLRAGSTKLMFSIKGANTTSWSTHVQLMRSYMVLNAALSEPGISDLPWVLEREQAGEDVTDWLGKQIRVTVPSARSSGNQIMKISMSGDDPVQLQKLVEAVTNAYLDRVVNSEKKGLLTRRDLLERTYRRKSEEVRKKREDLHELGRKVGTADSEVAAAQQKLLMDHEFYLRRQAGTTRQQHLQKVRALRHFEESAGWNQQPGAVLPGEFEEEILRDPRFKRFDDQMLLVEQKLTSYRSVLRNPSAGPIVEQEKELARLTDDRQQLLEERRAEILEAVRRGERKSKMRITHERLVEEVLELKKYHEQIVQEYLDIADASKKMGGYSADLQRRRQELTHAQKVTNALGYELEKMQLELSAGGADRIQLIQKPRLPRTANRARRSRMTWMAAAVGLALALGGTSLFEFHHRRVTSSDDMAEGLGIRVMGSVPMLTQNQSRFLRGALNDTVRDLQGTMDESVDGVRAMLLHTPQAKAVRTLLVTSAKAGEGKTTVSSSLAASMGRSGRRTLIVDGDLRRPSVHRLLDMPLEEGFAEVLRGEAAVEDVIRPSRATGLWFMSAGHCDHTSLQALTKDGVAQIFEKLRSEFDFIIVDSGPVLAVVDPLLLGQHCDGAILSVIRRVSQISSVHETCERLRSTGVEIVGCIVNGLHGNPFAPGYYSYAYGYGYGNGHVENGDEPAQQTPQPDVS